ncbi:MAG TPA: Fe-S cluster assembly protein SufD [Xanthomonadaceae bacterium]|nr:Fe-S cluster assembly protein SufD [Xanthomonadaceae bacterium]
MQRGFDPARAPGGHLHWLRDARGAHLAAFLRDGLPGPREEAWRYTPLRALERRAFAPSDPEAATRVIAGDAPGARLGSIRLCFVNGALRPELSDPLGSLPEGLGVEPLSAALSGPRPPGSPRLLFLGRRYEHPADAFARLNTALAVDGALIHVAAGARIEATLELVFIGAGTGTPTSWHLRNLVELAADARLDLIERHVSIDGADALGNVLTHIHVARGARLRHVRVQECDDAARLFARTEAAVAGEGLYEPLSLELGAALSRHELNVDLQGRGASVLTRGAMLLHGRRLCDTRLSIRHLAPGTTSDTLWRAIAEDRGRAAFHGGITIAEGADGSDAALTTRSLLLSDSAEIDAQPVLEIHADEVKASHGATVGQLDPAAMFYLRARGVPREQSRAMLTFAFCREVVDVLEDASLREALAERLRARVPGAGP